MRGEHTVRASFTRFFQFQFQFFKRVTTVRKSYRAIYQLPENGRNRRGLVVGAVTIGGSASDGAGLSHGAGFQRVPHPAGGASEPSVDHVASAGRRQSKHRLGAQVQRGPPATGAGLRQTHLRLMRRHTSLPGRHQWQLGGGVSGPASSRNDARFAQVAAARRLSCRLSPR